MRYAYLGWFIGQRPDQNAWNRGSRMINISNGRLIHAYRGGSRAGIDILRFETSNLKP
jgi:hypothetical protein